MFGSLQKGYIALYIRIFVSLFILCLFGCATRINEIETRGDAPEAFFEKGTNRVYRRGGSYSMRTPDSITPAVNPAANNLTGEERSAIIADAVAEMEPIISASAVITGNTVIVGIQTDMEYNDSELIDIKRLVEERVKATDKGIDHVSVTASADLLERIKRMPDAGISSASPIEPGDYVPRG